MNTNIADAQYNKMINTPVSKLISRLAIPTVISMLVTSIYNMADTFFVSHISTQASAAVGIVFPIMSIIQAFGFTLGMGSGSLVSRKLGEKKNQEASIISSTAFFSSLIIGAIIAFLGMMFSSFFMKLMGASESILPYANDYAQYIFWGAPIMCASFVLNNVLRSEGKALFSMIALSCGGIINIFLDPLLIFTFEMGIKGAAIATLISQTISFLILLSWFLRKKAICQLNIKLLGNISVFFAVVTTGLPSLARQGLSSIATILLNRAASNYGDSAIAAMAICTKIIMFVASIMIGIGQGFSPVAGYNYGAKRYDRVKQSYRFLVLCGMSIMAFFSVIGIIFAENILRAFIDDASAIQIGTVALRCQICVLPLHAIIVGANMLMQSCGQIKSATFLSCNRQGVYFIPAILILPSTFGLVGVEISQAVADFLSVLTSIPYAICFFNKLSKQSQINSKNIQETL